MNKDELTKELEKVLTIDGRGRPKKAQLLLSLIEKYGWEEFMKVVAEISTRKFF
jgi:dissimilatory sulfite reductase (desulfoviridin) alpha/beta subunit